MRNSRTPNASAFEKRDDTSPVEDMRMNPHMENMFTHGNAALKMSNTATGTGFSANASRTQTPIMINY